MEKIIKEGKVSFATMFVRFIIDFLAMSIFIGIFWLVRDLIYFFTTKLTITNTRIEGHKGIIHTVDLDSRLNKITGVRVEQGLFGKIFNYGTIRIATASEVFKFENISDPNEFRRVLSNQIEAYDEGKMDYQAKKIGEAIKV